MKLIIKKGTVDVTVYLFIQNSSVTTGAGLTGLVYNSAGLVCYYVRALGSAAQLTLATQTVTGAHADGGFVEVDATNMPGVYRLDLSDAIVATGSPQAVVMLKGATNMAPIPMEIQLVDFDPADGVRLGLTALPNAAAGAANGLPTAGTGTNQISLTGGAVVAGSLGTTAKADVNAEVDTALADVNLDHIAGTATGIPAVVAGTYLDQIMDDGTAAYDRTTDSLQAIRDSAATVGAVADAVWDEARSGHVVAGSFGEGAASVQGNITGSVGSLGATAKSDVNAEVVDVLRTDTVAELAAVPAANATHHSMLQWLFSLARNKRTTTGTTETLRNDADAANIATATVSDDGTTFTRGEWI